jgi:hypothetical protein
MSGCLNQQETAALIETQEFLETLSEGKYQPVLRELKIAAKAHAAIIKTVVTMKGNYSS